MDKRSFTVLLKIPLLIILSIYFIGCSSETNNSGSKYLQESVGKYGNILVVIKNKHWEGNIGNSLKETLMDEFIGISQYEPILDLIKVEKAGFSDLHKNYRNILFVDVNENNKEGVTRRDDKWAKNQIILRLKAKNEENMLSLIEKSSETVINIFEEHIIKTIGGNYKEILNTKEIDKLKNDHNLTLDIPVGYNLNLNNKDEKCFIASYKNAEESLWLLGYYIDFIDSTQFETQKIIEVQDSITQKYVLGTVDSSYMKIDSIYPDQRDALYINKNLAIEHRGLWITINDYLGGPYINYSTLDTKNNRIISLVGYINSPKNNKRNNLRNLEALIRSLKY